MFVNKHTYTDITINLTTTMILIILFRGYSNGAAISRTANKHAAILSNFEIQQSTFYHKQIRHSGLGRLCLCHYTPSHTIAWGIIITIFSLFLLQSIVRNNKPSITSLQRHNICAIFLPLDNLPGCYNSP